MMKADSRIRQLATLDVLDGKGKVEVRVAATSSLGYRDEVERMTRVVPNGFPLEIYASGQLKYEQE